MKRKLFKEEHELFRDQFRKFIEKEIEPYNEQWEKDGMVSRDLWRKAGANGFLCSWLPEEYGGSGVDFLYSVVMIEEMASHGYSGFALNLHNDIVVPYLWNFGSDEQKKRWLKKCATGEIITAVAMTEPNAGSDLQAMRTTAVKDGNQYVINGQKTFITNGILNDLVVVAVKTDTKVQPQYKGISLIVVEDGTPGYKKGKKFEKIGMHAQDTAELFFEDCRVPLNNILGGEGLGFLQLMRELQQERLVCAIGSVAGMHRALKLTKEYTNERVLFGKPLSKLQNTKFKMAEMFTMAEMAQVFIDRLIEEHVAGAKVDVETAMAKYWCTEKLNYVINECLQLFGGYGYMEEYPIAKAYRDARIQMIFAGANEVMKEIISRSLL